MSLSKALERKHKPKISIPLDGGNLLWLPLVGSMLLFACSEGLVVVNVAERTSRLLCADPPDYNRQF